MKLFNTPFRPAMLWSVLPFGFVAALIVLAVLMPMPAAASALMPLASDFGIESLGLAGLAFGGLVISKAELDALRTTFRADFKEGLKRAESIWKRIATPVPSSSKSNTYGWLGKAPSFREWIGPRVIQSMNEHSYTLVNKHFENTVGVDLDDWDDDNLGTYTPLFQEMGEETEVFPDELLFALIEAAETELCYDGQPFFDTEHPVYANHDGTGATTLVSNLSGAGAEPAWYLLDCSRYLKPFIVQNRTPPNFVQMNQPNDEGVFMNNEVRFGVDTRINVGLGFWQMARKSTLPLTAANFEAEREAMRAVRGDGDKKLRIRPTILLCGASLESAGEKILKAQLVNGGDTNTNAGKCELLSVDWLD
mgnify:CR=1 FL=1